MQNNVYVKDKAGQIIYTYEGLRVERFPYTAEMQLRVNLFDVQSQNTLSKPLKPKPQFFRKMKHNVQGWSTCTISTDFGKRTDTAFYRYGSLGSSVSTESRVLEVNFGTMQQRCWEKVFDQLRNGPDLAIDIAERRQTFKMIRQYFGLVNFVGTFLKSVVKTKAYKKIAKDKELSRKSYVDRQWRRMSREWRSGHPVEKQMIREKSLEFPGKPGPHHGQRAFDWATNKYLEYRYGWRPLVFTLYDTIDAIRKKRIVSWTEARARSGTRKSQTTRYGTGSFADPPKILSINGSYRCELGTYWSLPTGYSFADFISLSPLTWAWELLTLSFVVDWFVDVGQCLQNWENYYVYRNSYQGGWLTTTVREQREFSWSLWLNPVIPRFPNGDYVSGGWANFTYGREASVYVSKGRELVNSVPAPNGPRVKVNLNANRLLDAASLIWQRARQFR